MDIQEEGKRITLKLLIKRILKGLAGLVQNLKILRLISCFRLIRFPCF